MISALGRHEVSDYVLVRVTTDDGHEGAGEATVMPRWSGETVWSAKSLIDHLFAPALLGGDPRDVVEIDRRMDALAVGNPFAKAALEMACWDIQGKSAGKPVYELLGGAVRDHAIRCRFSLGAYEPEQAAQRAAERVAAGFTTIKVKVGGPPEQDIARVRAVREAIGQRVTLTVDANGGWDADTAIACLDALADCRIALVEQPTPRGDYSGMARVRRHSEAPVMADESCFEIEHARELLARECCDVLSLYPGKQSGILKARQIAELAAAHGAACSIGSNLEWDIATAAMGHLVVAMKNFDVKRYPGDMLGPAYHEFSIAREPIQIDGPLVYVPDRPGLGIDVDWAIVRANLIRH